MTDKKENKSPVKKSIQKKAEPVKPKKGKAIGGGFTRSLGGDRSLQAYKDWMRGMVQSINPNAGDTWTEEEWVKHWKEFWAEADQPTKKNEDTPKEPTSLEERYPGITEQIRRFENAELPPCPHCGSSDTASVQVGIIGRTININAATRKFKLVPNMPDKRGDYFCNKCGKYFDQD